MAEPETEIEEWWRTSIIDMEPGKISFWKHPIEELIGNVSFPQMIWLMLRGELPSLDETCLLYTSPSPRDATLSRMPSSA